MRREPTEAERRLWWALRHDPALKGAHLRRQVPIGPYIADFLSLQAQLIVEADGEQHGLEAGRAYDARRTEVFQAQGFRVLRFWNRDVMRETRVVVDTIFAALEKHATTPTPYPSPQGGGERRALRIFGEAP